jgi:hypothetical protein
MSDMKMETRKGYLEGILDQIIVTLNEDLTHRLAIRFKHPIVGDRHAWSNPKQKSAEYQVHDGTTDQEFSNTLTKHGGANLKKKSNMRELGDNSTPTLDIGTSLLNNTSIIKSTHS